MSETPDNDPNPPDPSNELGGQADDAELVVDIERMLDEASGAAQHLQDEIGLPGVPLTSDPAIDPLISEGPSIDVEQELAEVEAMLDGVAQPQDKASDDPLATQPQDEFELPEAGYDPTDRPEAEAAITEAAESDDEAPLVDHFDSAAPTAVEEAVPARTDDALPTSPEEAVDSAATVEPPNIESEAAKSAPQPSWRGRLIRARDTVVAFWSDVREHAGPFLEKTVQVMLRIMDVIDRRLAWINYDVRKILGGLAIALAVAAASMMIYSFS